MILLYTGAKEPDTKQNDPKLSLGGYKSSTIVPLNKINSLFSDLSYLSKQHNTEITRGFVLENNSQEDYFDLNLGYEYDQTDYKIKVAIVSLIEPEFVQMECIENQISTPDYANFIEANVNVGLNIDNSINLGDLKVGERLGIWIKIIPQNIIKSCQEKFDNQN